MEVAGSNAFCLNGRTRHQANDRKCRNSARQGTPNNDAGEGTSAWKPHIRIGSPARSAPRRHRRKCPCGEIPRKRVEERTKKEACAAARCRRMFETGVVTNQRV